jgi:negative regulator of flagellin synthesis FlgM
MSDIPPINNVARPVETSTRRVEKKPTQDQSYPSADRVEISQMAQALSTLEPNTDIRVDKVAAIKEAIENGTYETEEKVSATVDRLLDVLRKPAE